MIDGKTNILLRTGDAIFIRPDMIRERFATDLSTDYLSINFYSDHITKTYPLHLADIVKGNIRLLITCMDETNRNKHPFDACNTSRLTAVVLSQIDGILQEEKINPTAKQIETFLIDNYAKK